MCETKLSPLKCERCGRCPGPSDTKWGICTCCEGSFCAECYDALIDFATKQLLPLLPDNGRPCLRYVLKRMGGMPAVEKPVLKYGCCRCSGIIPAPEPPVVCGCCGRFYCFRCFTELRDFLVSHEREVCDALGSTPGRCRLGDIFEAIDRFMLAELLESIPVPPRDKGH